MEQIAPERNLSETAAVKLLKNFKRACKGLIKAQLQNIPVSHIPRGRLPYKSAGNARRKFKP